MFFVFTICWGHLPQILRAGFNIARHHITINLSITMEATSALSISTVEQAEEKQYLDSRGNTAGCPLRRRTSVPGRPVFQKDGLVLSIPDAISRVLEKRYLQNEIHKPGHKYENSLLGETCPDCGQTISFEEGCMTCHFCGFTKCG